MSNFILPLQSPNIPFTDGTYIIIICFLVFSYYLFKNLIKKPKTSSISKTNKNINTNNNLNTKNKKIIISFSKKEPIDINQTKTVNVKNDDFKKSEKKLNKN